MTNTDIINIILSSIVALTAVISIIIAIITMKQNSKMIEESTRPYVVVCAKTTNCQSPNFYLIVKNFGTSGAIITKFTCNHDLSKFSINENKIPFSNICGSTIAPHQSFLTNLNTEKLFDEKIILHFDIEYKSTEHTYNDSFDIPLSAYSELVQTRAATPNKELKIISYALQDLVEKHL